MSRVLKKSLAILFIALIILTSLSFGSISASAKSPATRPLFHLPKSLSPDLKEAIYSLDIDYDLKEVDDGGLLEFLKLGGAFLIYDIEAEALIDSGVDYYFYPLYEDQIVIVKRRPKSEEGALSLEALKDSKDAISFPEETQLLRYIWANISYGLRSKFDMEAPVDYFKVLYEEDRLKWGDPEAPINMNFTSRLNRADLSSNLIVASNPGLSFELGILSDQLLEEEILKDLKAIFEDYRSSFVLQGEAFNIAKSRDFSHELLSYENTTKYLRRRVYGTRRHVPADGLGSLLLSLVYIILIIIFGQKVSEWIILRGIRRGLLFTSMLLIAWISLGIFKYTLYTYDLKAHISWYMFYIFILPLPVLSLYIAENAELMEDGHAPIWLRLSGGFAILLIIMVLTNDFHQLVFGFESQELAQKGKNYSYEIGFYILSIWVIVSQLYAYFMLFKKGWDSPKKKKAILPILIFIMGISYSLLYNMKVTFFHQIPIYLGMSTIAIGFWVAAIYSGLIPNNKSYNLLFENSSLNMQIMDMEGNELYSTHLSTIIPEDIKGELLNQTEDLVHIQSMDTLIWSSAINGGRIVTTQNIAEINALKKKLQEDIENLEMENSILAQRERIRRDLMLKNQQNILANEDSLLVDNTFGRIREYIRDYDDGSKIHNNTFLQIHRLILYSKRQCELLIKSKGYDELPGQELCRLLQETSIILPEGYMTFCAFSASLSYEMAFTLYDIFHLLNKIALDLGLSTLTLRLYEETSSFYFYGMVDESTDKFLSKLKTYFYNNNLAKLSYKDLGDALSFTLQIEGGPYND